MSKVPDYAKNQIKDARIELGELDRRLQQHSIKHQSKSDKEMSEILYSISTVLLDLAGAVEGVIEAIEAKK